MLQLINAERTKAGLNTLQLGSNEAAQLHAEDMLRQGYLSHWNTEGLKPSMRYVLAGGEGVGAENISGPTYYVEPCIEIGCLRDPFEQLGDHMEGLMASIGHRWNILDEFHVFANLGIAYNGRTSTVVQQFEGDYLKYIRKPTIKNGALKFSGVLFRGLVLHSVHLQYDPLPEPLTFAQLARTYCGRGGEPLAFIIPPDYYYEEETFTIEFGGVCTDPRSVNPRGSTPTRDEHDLRIPSAPNIAEAVPWINAESWIVADPIFDIETDISGIIEARGPGVYVLILWAQEGDDAIPVSTYPIFHGDTRFPTP